MWSDKTYQRVAGYCLGAQLQGIDAAASTCQSLKNNGRDLQIGA